MLYEINIGMNFATLLLIITVSFLGIAFIGLPVLFGAFYLIGQLFLAYGIEILILLIVVFLYVLFFNLFEPLLHKHLFIDPNMKVFDYIWYTIFTFLIVFLSAALIHSITISSGLMTYLMMISLGILILLITYSIFYKVWKNRENLGKIVFIMTIYAILLTFIIVFLNKLVPANILKIFYVLYSFFIFGYVCSFVVLVCLFLYDLIVNPRKIQNFSQKFNVFGKINASAFKILSL